jgi:hypothetical protein
VTRAARAPLRPLHRVPERRGGGHLGLTLARRTGRHLRRGHHPTSPRARHSEGAHAGTAPRGSPEKLSGRHPASLADGLPGIPATGVPGGVQPDRDVPLESLTASRRRALRSLSCGSCSHCAATTPTTNPRAAEGPRPTADGGRSGIGQGRKMIRPEGRRLRSPPAVLPYASERIFMRRHYMWGSTIGLGEGLSGVFGPVGRRICSLLHLEFGE